MTLTKVAFVLLGSLYIAAAAAEAPGRHDSADSRATSSSGRTVVIVPEGPTIPPGRRVALVIGNGNYQYTEVLPKLPNPPNDAEDVSRALRSFGFDVLERKDLTLEGMSTAIAEFGSRIGGGEAALFYFAGHGLQVRGQNYLIPVNARIDSEASIPYQGINMNQVLDEMDNAKSRANIVMLDACRNNPISGKFRSGRGRGLAAPENMPRGTVIVYATDPGNVAADGEGRNGLFTAGLLKAFKGERLSLDDVLTVASADVERTSHQTQSPYVNGPKTLQKNFYFAITMISSVDDDPDTIFWKSIEHSSDPADFMAYRQSFPNGKFVALAENYLHRLKISAGTPVTSGATVVTRIDVDPHSTPHKLESISRVPGTVFSDCSSCPQMTVIPAGAFTMGSKSYETEKPPHQVRVIEAFALGRTEVTCSQWEAVMGQIPIASQQSCTPDLPITNISWKDANDFLRRLSETTGNHYRLPTEAEWEYACRAGKATEFCGGDYVDPVGWQSSASEHSQPVAMKQPNGWGLHDMSGNVWEWVEDCWNPGYQGAPSDGTAWLTGDCSRRVRRGGSWDNNLRFLRSAGRDFMNAALSSVDGGFRPAISLTHR